MSEITRRELLRRAAIAGLGAASWRIAGSAVSALASPLEPPRRISRNAGSVVLGAYSGPVGNQTLWTALLNLESMIGRQVDVYRYYIQWTDPVVNGLTQDLANRGTTIYLSTHAWTNGGKNPVLWADIAAGKQDAQVKAIADGCKQLGVPMYYCFHHEPEDDAFGSPGGQSNCGTPADFVAATQHVWDVFAAEGVTNAQFVITLMAATYNGYYQPSPDNWFPSTGTFHMGVDGYNRGKCFGKGYWKKFTDIFPKAQQYAAKHGRRLFIGECGCVEGNACGGTYSGTAKATWFNDALNVMKGWSNLEAYLYSHVTSDAPYRVDTSQNSLSAFTSLAHDPFYK